MKRIRNASGRIKFATQAIVTPERPVQRNLPTFLALDKPSPLRIESFLSGLGGPCCFGRLIGGFGHVVASSWGQAGLSYPVPSSRSISLIGAHIFPGCEGYSTHGTMGIFRGFSSKPNVP